MGISVQSNYYPGGGTPMRSLCSVFCVLCSEFCDLCSVFCVPCAVFCALFRVLCTVLCTVHCAAQQPVSKLLSGGRNSHESRQLDSPLHITTGHQTPVQAPVGASTRGFTTKHGVISLPNLLNMVHFHHMATLGK